MAVEIGGTLPAAVSTAGTAGNVDAGRAHGASGSAFASLIDSVQSADDSANTAVVGMLDGSVDIHDAMIALQRADLTMQMSVQLRNKLVTAYQEVMRMPV